MIKVCNHLGTIGVSGKYLRTLISATVQSCFGVAGMNPYGALQEIDSMIKKQSCANKGVIIRQNNNRLIIDLHITVTYGVNVKAITDSISHKVGYVLTEQAGVDVESVNVYVDEIVN